VSTTTRSGVRGPGGRAVSDRVHPASQGVYDLARLLRRDPAARTGSRGDLAVERHGPFGNDPRPAGLDQLEIRRVELPGFRLQQTDLDFDARPLQLDSAAGSEGRCAAAGHLREGIALGYDHARNARLDHRVGTRRGLPLMATGLQRDVHRGPGRPIAGQFQGVDLGMGCAEAPMPPLADNLGPAGDHTTDHRIRLDRSASPGGQFQGSSHVPEVEVGLGHGGRSGEWAVGSS